MKPWLLANEDIVRKRILCAADNFVKEVVIEEVNPFLFLTNA
jgi:hypothetical protein